MKRFKFKNYNLTFRINSYSNNNRLAVFCYNKENLYSVLTINLPKVFLNSINEVFIDPINKDIGLYQALIDEGIISEVLSENVPYNMGHYDLVKFDLDKLKEFDTKGYYKFLEDIGFEETISRTPKI